MLRCVPRCLRGDNLWFAAANGDFTSVVLGTLQMLMIFSVAFSLSLLCAISLYQARAYINRFVRRSDIQARQASHINPTLRLGGFGVAVGIFSSVPIMGDEARFFVYLALSSLPLVVVGFLEDIGIHQSARIRLVMAFVAGALVMLSLGLGVTRVGIPLLDPILGLFPVFVAFTLFTTAGVVHAFNIIDGLNGLAGANALMITGSLICISFMSGDYSTVHPLIVVLPFLHEDLGHKLRSKKELLL